MLILNPNIFKQNNNFPQKSVPSLLSVFYTLTSWKKSVKMVLQTKGRIGLKQYNPKVKPGVQKGQLVIHMHPVNIQNMFRKYSQFQKGFSISHLEHQLVIYFCKINNNF